MSFGFGNFNSLSLISLQDHKRNPFTDILSRSKDAKCSHIEKCLAFSLIVKRSIDGQKINFRKAACPVNLVENLACAFRPAIFLEQFLASRSKARVEILPDNLSHTHNLGKCAPVQDNPVRI